MKIRFGHKSQLLLLGLKTYLHTYYYMMSIYILCDIIL